MIQSLYVHRPLLNPEDLIEWATHQGFSKTLAPDDMHVTIAYSTKQFDWHRRLSPQKDEIHVVGDKRDVVPLGEKGATVLRFHHPYLHRRWKEILAQGASWDHEGYHPHVTISYAPSEVDLKQIQPYDGPLIFGPEKFAPIVLDWDKQITEIPLVAENSGIFPDKTHRRVKYDESITENKRMTDSLASLLMKNIDLILEAYNVDEKGNLVEVNRKKVAESDEIFHKYFVKSMNGMFRQINEADPILHDPNNMMSPMGGMNGMHPMDGGMGHDGMGEPGEFGDEGLGDAAMDDMQMGPDASMYGDAAGHHSNMSRGHMQAGGMAGGGMSGGGMSGGGMGGQMGESADYDWVFGEEADLDVDALFNLTEEDEEEEEVEEGEDEDDDTLNEFGMFGHQEDDMMGGGAGDMGGSMDLEGGHNDFGGDMGGMDQGDDDMMGGGDDMSGDDMMSVHGHLDNGSEFKIEFEKDALGFGDDMGGDEMGDDDMGGGGDFGGSDEHGSDEHHMDEPGMGSHRSHEDEDDHPIGEATMVKKGKPGKGQRGPRTARMAVVPANPASNHAAPFPTPQGSRQKK